MPIRKSRRPRVALPEQLPLARRKDIQQADDQLLPLSDSELLDLRMCDLKLTIRGTNLEKRIAQLNEELAARGLKFKPHFWLSEDWFSPDEVPGIAITTRRWPNGSPLFTKRPATMRSLSSTLMVEKSIAA